MLNTHVLFFPLSFDLFHISRVSPLESQKRTCTVLTFLPRILDVAQTEITTKDLYVLDIFYGRKRIRNGINAYFPLFSQNAYQLLIIIIAVSEFLCIIQTNFLNPEESYKFVMRQIIIIIILLLFS